MVQRPDLTVSSQCISILMTRLVDGTHRFLDPQRSKTTDILSRTISELSQQILFKYRTLCVFQPPLGGLRNNILCSSWAHGKRVVDFLLVLLELFSLGVAAEALRAKIDRKSAISLQRGQFDPKFLVEGDVPTNNFCIDG